MLSVHDDILIVPSALWVSIFSLRELHKAGSFVPFYWSLESPVGRVMIPTQTQFDPKVVYNTFTMVWRSSNILRSKCLVPLKYNMYIDAWSEAKHFLSWHSIKPFNDFSFPVWKDGRKTFPKIYILGNSSEYRI